MTKLSIKIFDPSKRIAQFNLFLVIGIDEFYIPLIECKLVVYGKGEDEHSRHLRVRGFSKRSFPLLAPGIYTQKLVLATGMPQR